jgi:hypothetical protein
MSFNHLQRPQGHRFCHDPANVTVPNLTEWLVLELYFVELDSRSSRRVRHPLEWWVVSLNFGVPDPSRFFEGSGGAALSPCFSGCRTLCGFFFAKGASSLSPYQFGSNPNSAGLKARSDFLRHV